jgi:hypothetical protein
MDNGDMGVYATSCKGLRKGKKRTQKPPRVPQDRSAPSLNKRDLYLVATAVELGLFNPLLGMGKDQIYSGAVKPRGCWSPKLVNFQVFLNAQSC